MRAELSQLKHKPKVLVLGSGGLSIGQAGEFDYSGTQAVKALLEENFSVLIVNPNIATVQTNPREDCKVFLYPVEPAWVEKVIEQEKPDAIIAGFGGQTALNCLIQLHDSGFLHKHKVLNLGTSIDTLKMTEDRDLFAKKMSELGIPTPPSKACCTVEEAVEAAESIEYPVIVRAAYALGGLGSGFAYSKEELVNLVEHALQDSPQVLVEKSLRGWKEVEYEIMRDSFTNAITICNMENFDPLGVHTGDSIVVCPSQSLSDDEYQILRNASLKMVEAMNIVGECNAQFALDPHSHRFYVIEVNARLSRSSALASKASGYPIAYIAAKVVLGFSLLDLKNPVTGITYSYFEPALDYVTIKIPRWDMGKFRGASRKLDSTMKSVGEVMSIGRTFPEALQKAVRMVTESSLGLSDLQKKYELLTNGQLEEFLINPTDERLPAIMAALRRDQTTESINKISAIDSWFLSHLSRIAFYEDEISKCSLDKLEEVSAEKWHEWKINGFADEQIAYLLLGKDASQHKIGELGITIRQERIRKGVKPVIKRIDTTAGEYPSPSNYLYLSYAGRYNDSLEDKKTQHSAIILGGGAYRVGTSVEFDWCAVSSSKRLSKAGWESIMINCNPETVSTDYNSSDRLYFEELTLERILDIYDYEQPTGIIPSMGGQLPNRLVVPLAKAGVNLLGHSPETIDMAEDRNKFSATLDSIGIDQPRWISATSKKDVDKFIAEVSYPVLIRPSYVLSGAAMAVAVDETSLNQYLSAAEDINKEHPVVISEFLLGAREIELDGISANGEIIVSIVSEHIENAGTHSGDATMVVPAQKLYVETVRRIKKAGRMIAKKLCLNGPFNMQFLAKHNHIKVIECNARAARSFPYVSKVVSVDLADIATQVMIGAKPDIKRVNEDDLPHVGVKAAMFSFKRLIGADPILGVEMASTGEVGCLGANFEEALLLALEATGALAPTKGVLLSIGTEADRAKFLKIMPDILKLKLPVYATCGTAEYFKSHKYSMIPLARPNQSEDGIADALETIRAGKIDLVVNLPKRISRTDKTFGGMLRQVSTRYGAGLFTNPEKASAFILALSAAGNSRKSHKLLSLPPFKQ